MSFLISLGQLLMVTCTEWRKIAPSVPEIAGPLVANSRLPPLVNTIDVHPHVRSSGLGLLGLFISQEHIDVRVGKVFGHVVRTEEHTCSKQDCLYNGSNPRAAVEALADYLPCSFYVFLTWVADRA